MDRREHAQRLEAHLSGRVALTRCPPCPSAPPRGYARAVPDGHVMQAAIPAAGRPVRGGSRTHMDALKGGSPRVRIHAAKERTSTWTPEAAACLTSLRRRDVTGSGGSGDGDFSESLRHDILRSNLQDARSTAASCRQHGAEVQIVREHHGLVVDGPGHDARIRCVRGSNLQPVNRLVSGLPERLTPCR